MKKWIFTLIILLIVILIIVFAIKLYNDNSLNTKITDNISVSIKDGTLTKTSVTIVITDNNKDPCWWGENYIISKNIFGDLWINVPLISDYTVTALASYGKNGVSEFDIDWTKKYGKLKKGKYRIFKAGYAYVNDNSIEVKVYTDFEIK